jgi:hypothetical protein
MTTNQFAKKLAAIANESGFLYKDTLDQDTLFFVADAIANLLIEANRDKSITNKTMFEFEHVFYQGK